jgi:ATP-dependent Clp protease ATP-binding subunit ClpA
MALALLFPAANKILTAAASAAKERDADRLDCEHLLLALVADEDDPAARVLASFGIDYRAVAVQLDGPLDSLSPADHSSGYQSIQPAQG